MRFVHEPLALVGAFFVAAGLLLYAFERTRSPGVAIGFGALYAAAGVALIAWGLKPKPLP